MSQGLDVRVLPRAQHDISRSQISSGALRVLYRLHRAGYLAYLVGGSVRDLMLGRTPKDFDIATNARPQEVRRLFRNSRIIGRRFRLVHVMFAGEIVEVSTFRASPEPPEAPEEPVEGEAWEDTGEEPAPEGLDANNLFGTPVEDAWRRDFTVNALFYSIADFSVIDHVGGIDDLRAGLIRSIGRPEVRFAEDPVRMMRALEYSTRLGFRLDDATATAIRSCRETIREAAPARLAYELLEGLRSGSSAGICAAWRSYGLLDAVFPEAAGGGAKLLDLLTAVDARVLKGEQPRDATLLGVALLPSFARVLGEVLPPGAKPDNPVLLTRIRELLEAPAARLHLSNYTAHLIHHGFFTISKLFRPPQRGRQVLKLVRQDYFPVGWELFSIGATAGLFDREAYAAWSRSLERVELHSPQAVPVDEEAAQAPARRRRRRGGRRRRS